jgi:hypothetical protein
LTSTERSIDHGTRCRAYCLPENGGADEAPAD